jgi:hypothetical protein
MGYKDIEIEVIDGLKEKLLGSPACADIEDRKIYLDSELEGAYRRLVIIHEVLEIWLHGRVKHSKIDRIALDIIEALRKEGEIE